LRDIAPVASITRNTSAMVVNPSSPAKTVSQFVAYAKANPGKINMATAGVGSPPHVYGVLFNAIAGVESLHCINDPQSEGHMASYIARRKFLATLWRVMPKPKKAALNAKETVRLIGTVDGSLWVATEIRST
jgi:Tripartite tricarboxylate transporter family receptor